MLTSCSGYSYWMITINLSTDNTEDFSSLVGSVLNKKNLYSINYKARLLHRLLTFLLSLSILIISPYRSCNTHKGRLHSQQSDSLRYENRHLRDRKFPLAWILWSCCCANTKIVTDVDCLIQKESCRTRSWKRDLFRLHCAKDQTRWVGDQ